MKIAVIGSLNLDLVVKSERIPLKGETIFGETIVKNPGGKGANQAVALGKIGADVSMFGAVGDDDAGELLIDALKNANVKTENIKIIKNENTGTAFITIAEDDNTIVVVPGANALVDKNYIDSVEKNLLTNDIFLLQNEIPEETVKYLIELGYKNNKKVILNPAPIRKLDEKFLNMLSYLTPNEHEAKILFGDGDLNEIVKKYNGKLIVTLGSDGVITSKDGEIIKIDSIKANVVDTTGAGDTFNGAFTYMISENKSIEEALKFANYSAGISVEKFGAQTGMPVLEEVLKRMELYK